MRSGPARSPTSSSPSSRTSSSCSTTSPTDCAAAGTPTGRRPARSPPCCARSPPTWSTESGPRAPATRRLGTSLGTGPRGAGRYSALGRGRRRPVLRRAGAQEPDRPGPAEALALLDGVLDDDEVERRRDDVVAVDLEHGLAGVDRRLAEPLLQPLVEHLHAPAALGHRVGHGESDDGVGGDLHDRRRGLVALPLAVHAGLGGCGLDPLRPGLHDDVLRARRLGPAAGQQQDDGRDGDPPHGTRPSGSVPASATGRGAVGAGLRRCGPQSTSPTASTSRAAATVNPSQPVGGSAMPSAPPTTQDSCSTVSERANAEARRLSGTSRWMIASSATLPSALATAATPATRAAVAKL